LFAQWRGQAEYRLIAIIENIIKRCII